MLRIYSIFDTLSGEVTGFGTQGCPATFIRLAGCNLGCSWCDTPKARNIRNGEEMAIDDIIQRVEKRRVVITGGEPLLQMINVKDLIHELLNSGKQITVETNGSIPVPKDLLKYNELRFVVDYKLPSSRMMNSMRAQAFERLRGCDVVKFVVADHTDFTQMQMCLRRRAWSTPAKIAVSPLIRFEGDLGWAKMVAQSLLNEPELGSAKLNLQLHKLLRME